MAIEEPSPGAAGPAGAFTLVELLVAVGLTGAGLVVTIGWLGLAARDVRNVLDRDIAHRLVAAVSAECDALTWAEITRAVVAPGAEAPSQYTFFAPAEGDVLVRGEGAAASRRYFAVVLERVPALSPPAMEQEAVFLAVHLRIEWPNVLADGTTVPRARRHVFRSPYVRLR